jgi:hypothetical protein
MLILTLYIKVSRDNSDPILVAGTKLANILRQKKAFTNTATFDLKCEVSDAPSSAVLSDRHPSMIYLYFE